MTRQTGGRFMIQHMRCSFMLRFIRCFCAATFLSGAGAATLEAIPVTGWLKDTSFGGGPTASLTQAHTSSPILGNGTSNNADNTAIYAPFPVTLLTNGQSITLTGSAQMIGTSATPEFRWGLFKDDGAGAVAGGWLGFLATGESAVWSKDPMGSGFLSATFASTANGRAFQLGSAEEANGVLFSPGTYNFVLTLERYGNEIDARYSLSNQSTGFSISSPFFTETEPERLTFAFDRVGFLAGGALDADQIRFSNVQVNTSAVTAPKLSVHSSGSVFIENATASPLQMTQYEITSTGGGLNKNGWVSLDDQENNDPLGAGWEEAGGSGANVLAEVHLNSPTSSLMPGHSLRLGSAYVPNGAKDLAFRFTPVDGTLQRGIVEYVVSGDFNRDLHLDAADYVLWRKQLGASVAFGSGADADGNGLIQSADLTFWRSNYGAAQPFGGTLGALPVPEPTTATLSLIVLMGGAITMFRKKSMRRCVALACLGLVFVPQARAQEVDKVAGDLITFNTNGAWSWYMDERVVVDTTANRLLISTVTDASGTGGASRNGDIDFLSYDLASGHIDHFVLHDELEADDHNNGAILVRPDGRYLSVYTKHNKDKLSHFRISTNPHDATSWGPQQSFDWSTTPGSDFNVTYSNLFYLPSEGRTYNFARANNRSPNMMVSMNDGSSWSYGGKLLATASNVGYVNGYLKYASNGVDRIDFIATEHHPRDFNNNIYHGYIQGGKMYRSNGTLVDNDIFDNSAPNQTSLTKVFAADPENGSQVFTRAWTTDLHVDSDGNPYAIFTTRANDIPINTNGFNDHRFFYARYDGSQWNVHHLAKAGPRLYTSEQDYTGLVALHPHDPNTLFMSTPIDPRDETELGVHEIFKGVTSDGGANWAWTPITFDSQVDNLRPTVPLWDEDHTAVVWLRGTYRSMFDFDLDVVGLTSFGPLEGRIIGDLNGDRIVDIDNDYAQYVAWMYKDLSGLSPAEAYAKGDLNGDLLNNAHDFAIFRQAYDNFHNQQGAFNAALVGVPEPSTLLMLALAGAVTCYPVRWR